MSDTYHINIKVSKAVSTLRHHIHAKPMLDQSARSREVNLQYKLAPIWGVYLLWYKDDRNIENMRWMQMQIGINGE